MRNFYIGGEIVNDSADVYAIEDVTPTQVRAVLNKLDAGEEIVFEISSPGGSVTAGVAIANLIKKASSEGHKTTAHVVGVAASMASVIACACDSIEIDESAFFMIHNPWTQTSGDANQLRRDAALLDHMRGSIISFYRSKFSKTDEELIALMDAETWFTGAESKDFGFYAKVIPNEAPLRVAACARSIPTFARMPKGAVGLIKMGKEVNMTEETHEVKASEEVVETAPAAVAEEPKAEAPVEEAIAEIHEEPKAAIEEAPIMIAIAECEKRVSGMQSVMAKKMDALRKDYDAKIIDFKNQLKAKEEELAAVNAKATSLAAALDKSMSELSETASALEERATALDTLNAKVNQYAEARRVKSLAEIIADPKSTIAERMEAARREADRANH